MLHKKTEPAISSIQGTGIFATDKIKRGEIVWWETQEEQQRHDEVPITVVKGWPKEQQRRFRRYAYQIGENLYAGYRNNQAVYAADFINHSCDLNLYCRCTHTQKQNK